MSVKERIKNRISRLGKERTPKPIRLLRLFGGFLFLFLIFLLALTLGTTERGLEGMTHSFVDSKEVDESYYEHYLEYGFTNESCRELLEGEEIKHLTADVMVERLRAIFKNTHSYKTSLDEAKERIRAELIRVKEAQGLEMDETSLETLVDYTADISGISTMFWYDTPAEYRTAVFDASKSDTELSNSLLSTLATLSSPLFMLLIFAMFIVILALLWFFDKKEKRVSFLNMTLYPALAVLGFSIGEVFMPDASAVTDYVFRLLALSSLIGIVFGVFMYIMIRLLEQRKGSDQE